MDDVSSAIRKLVREEVNRAIDERFDELRLSQSATATAPAATAPHLTPAQAVHLIGFAQQTLANWRSLGKGPTWFRIGRLVRYDEAEIERWLEEARG